MKGETGQAEGPERASSKAIPVLGYTVAAVLAWTLCVGVSLVWNVRDVRDDTRDRAVREARAHFNKDQAFRLWATSHGGVYVPVDSRTPPNPNLSHVPERDITTPSGKRLTLMNPAYMVRQLMDDYSAQYGIRGRITSLKPLWEGNAPDAWERRALKAFEEGAKEVFEFTTVKGEPYLRLMRPMVTQKGCLKCHGFQGYKEGDIRGGVGVSVPMAPLMAIERRHIITLYFTHAIIWLLGLAGIVMGAQRISRNVAQRQRSETSVRQSERLLRKIADNYPNSYLSIINRDLTVGFTSGKEFQKQGLDPESFVGLSLEEVFGEHTPVVKEHYLRTFAGEETSFEIFINNQYQLYHTVPLYEDDEISRILAVAENITEWKQAEEAIRQKEELLHRVVNNAPIVLWSVDAEGVFTLSEGKGLGTLGLRPGEVVGRSVYEVYRDVPQIIDEIRRSLAGESFRSVVEVGELYFDTRYEPLMDEQGQVAGVLGVSTDITQQQAAREKLEKEVEYLRSMRTIDIMITTSLDLRNILSVVLEQVSSRLSVDAADVLLLNEQNNVLKYAAGSGFRTKAATQTALRLGDGYAGRAALERRPLMLPDIAQPEEEGVEPPALMAEEGFQAYFGVPLIVKGAVKGILEIYYRAPFAPDMEWVERLEALSGQAAIALDNATMFTDLERSREKLEKQVEYLRSLRTIDIMITASLDLRHTLNVFLEQVAERLNVDATDVLLLNEHTKVLEYAAGSGFRTRAVMQTALRLGDGYAGRAALERRPLMLPDIAQPEEEGLEPPALMAEEGFQAYFGVPLIAKGAVKGVLEIYYRAPFAPDMEWVERLETLAGQAAIALDNATMFTDLQRSRDELVLAYDSTIEGWANALDLRDKETEGHSRRVTDLTVRVAREMGMDEQELVHVRRGALLHDIGKMSVPDGVLFKDGPLTDEERDLMHRHPEFAFKLLHPIKYLRPALDIPYSHHERWDGTGYPRGLRGEQIPLAARIFAVVDTWDALLQARRYHEAWSPQQVREHIRSLAGTHFDPAIVEVFLRMTEEEPPPPQGPESA